MVDFQVDHTHTDGHTHRQTYIRTCWAASSQPKSSWFSPAVVLACARIVIISIEIAGIVTHMSVIAGFVTVPYSQ